MVHIQAPYGNHYCVNSKGAWRLPCYGTELVNLNRSDVISTFLMRLVLVLIPVNWFMVVKIK